MVSSRQVSPRKLRNTQNRATEVRGPDLPGSSGFGIQRSPVARLTPLNPEIESFPAQLFEIADISPIEGTIGLCNYWFSFTSPRNRTQEADGSIPFISANLLDF